MKRIEGLTPTPDFEQNASETAGALWTKSDAPHVIASALEELEGLIAAEQQGSVVSWIAPEGSDIARYSDAEMRAQLEKLQSFMKTQVGKGPEGMKAINTFLKENGFTIQLKEEVRGDELGAASIFKFTDQWNNQMHRVTVAEDIRLQGTETMVPALRAVDVDCVDIQNGPVYRLRTLTQARNPDDGIFAMPQAQASDNNSQTVAREVYEQFVQAQAGRASKVTRVNLRVPMVDLRRSGRIDSIVGATAEVDGVPSDYVITEAVYEHSVQMNEKGFAAAAAAAVQATRGMSGFENREVTVDQPFLLFVVNNGVVSFAAHIEQAEMRKPEIAGLE